MGCFFQRLSAAIAFFWLTRNRRPRTRYMRHPNKPHGASCEPYTTAPHYLSVSISLFLSISEAIDVPPEEQLPNQTLFYCPPISRLPNMPLERQAESHTDGWMVSRRFLCQCSKECDDATCPTTPFYHSTCWDPFLCNTRTTRMAWMGLVTWRTRFERVVFCESCFRSLASGL